MNDRFKFRIWDTKSKVYIYSGSIDIRLGIFLTGNLLDAPRFRLEQCTGLKDKNGKLIYEGDILKSNGNTITKEVVYEDGSYLAKDTIYFHDKCHIFQKWINECGYEIVGNIHENKELLK